ncbi:MAG TPA: FAD-binding protein [Gaiellaceae bacterium]|nr:FAD-binding protein [Gaiellaceae bacterium]
MQPDVVIAGAGMAGLVASARLRELGVRATVHERGDRPGGSMLLSSGFVWRHREWEDFRRECPGGDEALQRLVWERFDDAIAWLQGLGAEPTATETGNPLTAGARFDPRALSALLARNADIRYSAPAGDVHEPLVLCTGGFSASTELVGRYVRPAAPLRLRGNPWSLGDGLRIGLDRGGALSRGMDEFYGRNMPDAPWSESELVALSQLYARHARIFDEDGSEFFAAKDVTWSETNVVAATARRPGARAYYLLDEAALSASVRDRTVAEMVAAAPVEARVDPEALPFAAPAGTVAAVRVVASITHTIGGLSVDVRGRVLGSDGRPLPALWAAGVDAGGVATGGYASGLAQALVLGLAAAEDVAATLGPSP